MQKNKSLIEQIIKSKYSLLSILQSSWASWCPIWMQCSGAGSIPDADHAETRHDLHPTTCQGILTVVDQGDQSPSREAVWHSSGNPDLHGCKLSRLGSNHTLQSNPRLVISRGRSGANQCVTIGSYLVGLTAVQPSSTEPSSSSVHRQHIRESIYKQSGSPQPYRGR